MLTTIILILAAAIPSPRYVIDDVTLTEPEAVWLLSKRVEFEREQLRRIQAVSTTIADASGELAELARERDALQQGSERDAVVAQIAAIEAGVTERGKVAIKAVRQKGAARPAPSDARRVTLAEIYNYDAGIIRGNKDSNETLNRSETGFPVWLFAEIDANMDAELTAAEIRAYWDGLR